MNLDMSEIIEFVLPPGDYPNEDNDISVGNVDVNVNEDATYVVLEGLSNEYDEDFLVVNEELREDELQLEEPDLDQQLDSDTEFLAQDQYVVTELPSETEEMIEEEDDECDDGENDFEQLYTQPSVFEEADEPEPEHEPEPEPEPESELDLDSTLEPEPELESESPPVPVKKFKANPQSVVRTYNNILDEDEPPQYIEPSKKLLDVFKGPRRYLLFDDLLATIVDFDENTTPIVEFSMSTGVPDEKLPVECGICPDVMHKSKLSKHQKLHLVPGSNRYSCIYCAETYRDCKYLAGHARRHMGIRPYVCHVCKLYFSTKQDLRVHNQRRHQKKEHICELCGKKFAQNTQLKRHREATHEKKRRFQCQRCQKAYYKNFSLQEHIRNVHMGKRRMLKCPFCGMQCRDAHKMARHRKDMHLNQDSFVCHLCQEEFTDINYFDAHKRSIQCRTNTKRYVKELHPGASGSGVASGLAENDEDAMGLEEDFDEDAGLLLEEANPDDPDDNEYANGAYFQEVDPRYVQISDYDGQMVEGVVLDEEEPEEDSFNEQKYYTTIPRDSQQEHSVGQETNADELIYEITLKTEDDI
ncbi:zinc finger protein 583 [Drosophila pseudoobscura]|uniref:Zinc finger protein 583 n=1 Tax=Drosophila pseudoobscura pseudoobscura TaxID=46245 RepID=A0A6I8UFQ8_DROPS|nr:zinc finger protein 583 [Drosophila pseudoobscura]